MTKEAKRESVREYRIKLCGRHDFTASAFHGENVKSSDVLSHPTVGEQN
jgi:hypothetical protein